jgi:hypothetical protein
MSKTETLKKKRYLYCSVSLFSIFFVPKQEAFAILEIHTGSDIRSLLGFRIHQFPIKTLIIDLFYFKIQINMPENISDETRIGCLCFIFIIVIFIIALTFTH